jgi:hypothetical protein
MLNGTQPHVVFPPRYFLLLQSSYVCRIMRCFSYWFLYLFIADVLCFVLRSYVCKILGLYHVLMYVCRLHRFVVPWFFCSTCFFVLRSYVCKILGLNHVLMYVLMYLDYWFLLPTIFILEFPRMWNSTIFLLVLNSYVRRSNILFQFSIWND